MSSGRPSPRQAFRQAGLVPGLALTAGGLGFLRPASGTWGSLPPVVVAVGLANLGQPVWSIEVSMILLLAIGTVACLRFGRIAEETFGKKDPGQVVADEVAGQAVTLLFLPWAGMHVVAGEADAVSLPLSMSPMVYNLALGTGAFLLFRIFDILKPPPARGLQRLKGGLGILVDDLIAGAMAAVVLQIAFRVLLPLV